MPEKQLFGTDGIRGIAGEYPLDEPTVSKAGQALGICLKKKGQKKPLILMGEDTRESSRWIAETFAAGLAEEGLEARSAGVITTPGVAYLARTDRFAAGVMISASHNPYRDNGIKVFAHTGYKLPDEQEQELEECLFALKGRSAPRRLPLQPDDSLGQRYLDFLCGLMPPGRKLDGLRMVLDCAHGSASELAPELFRRLGARVTVINAEPDGRNINKDCGSLHTAGLQARVPAAGADLGVAFDGDADRALFSTARGELVNGDGVLLMAARRWKAAGRLKNLLVVATIMSNLGLERALDRENVRMLRTPVGDKYVLEEMLSSGANLGGEQSGHIIFADDHTTGCGLLTALRVAQIMVESGKPLEELIEGLEVFPQVIKNVPVRKKLPLDTLPEVSAAIRASRDHFGESGRVIVRYSGTETLLRIMVEGPDLHDVEEQAGAIARTVERVLGAP